MIINQNLQIPSKELNFSFTKSSGPGGQKVNKTNSCVILSWSVLYSPSVSEYQRTKLLDKLSRRINSDGELLIRSDRFRDRGKNIADCIEKLQLVLQKALSVQKKRVPTKPSKASKKKRVDNKKKNADKKQLRKKPNY